MSNQSMRRLTNSYLSVVLFILLLFHFFLCRECIHPLWGESVKAVVVLKENTKSSESEIIAFCKAHVASYKKPKSVEFFETLPKSAYGKVLKRELREKYPV
ncbi:MAG: hypothetical protein JSV31_02965 [Desulfobacterales bacterium]|nr:MAG: hypothetical protein JSV31_02965 [Desulfobacterales bacterium]